MMKWLLAPVLIVALLFAAGLRIDFKALADKLQKKPDANVEALLKMGIDPEQVGYKGKKWWSFDPEDNLFKELPKLDPVKKMSEESWQSSQEMKKKLGPAPGGDREAQAQAMAAQARLNQQRMEQRIREME